MWQMVDAIIIPILTYWCEGWTLNKEEKKKLQSIFNEAMKTLLCLPKGTPTTILLHETGNIPLEYTIKTRTILQAKIIDQMKEESLTKYITKTETSLWKKKHRGNHKRIPCIRANDHINQIRLEDPDPEAKFAEEIENDAEWKPKINHWLARRRDTKIGTRPKRMETLNRKQCSAILRARASMR